METREAKTGRREGTPNPRPFKPERVGHPAGGLVRTGDAALGAWAVQPKAPPLKSVKDGAPQVQNLNSKWTYGSSIRVWNRDHFVERERAGHPPVRRKTPPNPIVGMWHDTPLHRIHVLTVQLRYDLLMTGFLLGQSSPWNLTLALPNSLLSRKAESYVFQPENS
jgi:hypothetical protein